MNAFGAVLTIVVLIAVAIFIWLFEGRRARRIEDDLRQMARERDDTRRDDPQDRPPG